jgi:hypothetical protein
LRRGAGQKVSSPSAPHAPGAAYLNCSRPVEQYILILHLMTSNDKLRKE